MGSFGKRQMKNQFMVSGYDKKTGRILSGLVA